MSASSLPSTPPEQRWAESQARKQAAFRWRLQPTFDSPPAIVVLEQASLECPHCGKVDAYTVLPANRITCSACSAQWQIDCWILPRKSGYPSRTCDAAFSEGYKTSTSAGGEQAGMQPAPTFQNVYLSVRMGAYQCPSCAHLNRMKYSARNSFQCGRCRRHWELLVRVEGLPLAAAS